MSGPKPPINVQDGFFYQFRRDNTLVEVTLLTERVRVGRIRRFDKYAMVLEVDGREELVYKHAIATVAQVASAASGPQTPRSPDPVRPAGA